MLPAVMSSSSAESCVGVHHSVVRLWKLDVGEELLNLSREICCTTSCRCRVCTLITVMVSPTLGPNFIGDFYFACYRTRTTALWVSRSSKSESACAFAAACNRMYVTACSGVCGLTEAYGTRVTIVLV